MNVELFFSVFLLAILLEPLMCILVVFLLFRQKKLSSRLRKCEALIQGLQNRSPDRLTSCTYEDSENKIPPPIPSEVKKVFDKEAVGVNAKKGKFITQVQKVEKLNRARRFKLPQIVKENWTGVFGSAVLVVGAVFFGLTANIMQRPEIRVGMMMVVSLLFWGISQRLKHREDWVPLCGWLKSIAGSVTLFATLGGASIKGLKFIDSPIMALLFLCCGVAANIGLAITTPRQAVASLHVILSLAAFCIIPQTVALLPIGTIITCVGLRGAYRSKWDMHLVFILTAFAAQHCLWTFSLKDALLPAMHLAAIGCSMAVAFVAAYVHYQKRYCSEKPPVLSLVAHVTNWGLLLVNICSHAPYTKGVSLAFGLIAVVGFGLAGIAKRRGITWVYHTDCIFAQCAIIAAIVSTELFSLKLMDLSLIILLETFAFSAICRLMKEDVLLRAGLLFLCASFISTAYFATEALLTTPVASQVPIYVRLGVIALLSLGMHHVGTIKQWTIDDWRLIVFGRKEQKGQISVTAIGGTLFLMGMYCFGFHGLIVQAVVLATLYLCRRMKEDLTWNSVFLLSLAVAHIFNWKPNGPLQNYVGLAVFDAILIFGNFLRFDLWKKNLHAIVAYALGIQVGLVSYAFTKNISLLIPGVLFLGSSIVFLEAGRMVPKFFKYPTALKDTLEEGMAEVGLFFLIAFISRFVSVNMQIDPLWQGVSLRMATELLGLLTIIYWMVFYPNRPRTRRCLRLGAKGLVDLLLGFATLTVFIEVAEAWRPLVWALMAPFLYFGVKKYKWNPRLFVYSWVYLIASAVHVGFVTYNLRMPSLFAVEGHHLPTFLAIGVQLFYASALFKFENVGYGKWVTLLYRNPSVTALLPVFLCIALFFAFNFEKTILTLLWVGLTTIYLCIGLWVKSKLSIQVAMGALVLCSLRLVIFDLVQSDLATRAGVFTGVGILMLAVSILYKKYKKRIEVA